MEDSSTNNNNNAANSNSNENVEENLIDMLAEDDCLLSQPILCDSSSSGNMVKFNFESSQNLHEKDMKDTADVPEYSVQAPKTQDLSKLERKGKSGKYNLRKSLAWDNAFFTSAGVLEPEELTCIIEGAEKDESSMLPQIQEDVHKSTDSLSTLGGESLENLEVGLFEDIRASIQRSSKASSTPDAKGKTKSGTIKVQTPQSSKVDTRCRSKMTPKMIKGAETSNTRMLGKSTKQSTATSKDSCFSLPKIPKAAEKDTSDSGNPSKRGILGANRFKAEKCNIKSAALRLPRIATGAAPVSKIPPSGPRSTLPRPTSSKSSSNTSTAKIERKSSSSSLDSLGSTFSGKTSCSPSVRRKVVSRVGNLPSSAAISNNTSRAVSKDRSETGTSQLSAYLKSMTKLSPSVSPASSISEWSSESSSSNIAAYQGSNSSRTSLDYRRASVDISKSQTVDSQNHSIEQRLAGQVTKGSGLLGQHAEKTSNAILPNPTSAKPTGLKMPSTKFGFFDGAKPMRTPKGSMRPLSTVAGGLPKIAGVAANPSKGMIKENPVKSQPSKSTSKNIKVELPSATVKSMSPVAGDVSSTAREVSKNVKRLQHKFSPQSSREILFAEDVKERDIAKHNLSSCSSDLNLGVLDSKTSVDINSGLHTDGRREIEVENISPLKGRDMDMTDVKQDLSDIPSLLGNNDVQIQKEANGDSYSLSQTDNATIANLEILSEENKQEPKDVPALLGNKDTEISKEGNSDLSLVSQSDNSTKANSCSLEISCTGKLFRDHHEESLLCLSKPIASEPFLETVVGSRTPLAVKNSLYNLNELPDTVKKSTEAITEKSASCPLEGILKENGSDSATA